MSSPKSVPVLLFFGALAILLSAAPALPQANMTVVQEEAFRDDQRPPAVFKHDGHNVEAGLYDCSVCHHVYKNGEKLEAIMSVDKECSDCHGLKAGEENSMPLRKAYHTQCLSCHRDRGKGPLGCGECHVKK